MFMSGLLYELADLIIKKHVPIITVSKILLYRLPAIFVLAFPIAALFATIFALGRLAKDNEVTVMRMSGFGIHRILFPFILLGLVMSIGNYYINEELVPWTNHQAMNLVRQVMLKDVTPSIKENVFIKAPDDRHFYVRRVDRKEQALYDVIVYELKYDGQKGPYPRIITAQKGVFTEDTWELENGVLHEFDELGFSVKEGRFDNLAIQVSDGLDNFFSNTRTTEEMSRSELSEEIEDFLKSGIDLKSWRVDYHMKLAKPFIPLIFVIVGAPLVIRKGKGWWLRIVLTLVLGFAYFVVQSLSYSLGTSGLLAPLWAAWLPNIIFFLFGLLLLIREEFWII